MSYATSQSAKKRNCLTCLRRAPRLDHGMQEKPLTWMRNGTPSALARPALAHGAEGYARQAQPGCIAHDM
eukprot:5100735-Alexandrium_andersonii.AAC.1